MTRIENEMGINKNVVLNAEIKAQFDTNLIQFEKIPGQLGQKIIPPTKYPEYKIVYTSNGQEVYSYNFYTKESLLENPMGFVASDLNTRSDLQYAITPLETDFDAAKLEVVFYNLKGELSFNFRENDIILSSLQGIPKEQMKSGRPYYSEREIINN